MKRKSNHQKNCWIEFSLFVPTKYAADAITAATDATPPWCSRHQSKLIMQQTKNGCLIVIDITTTTTEETS